ncbi:MAG: site-specific integrase [Rickettsiales bacterium]|jgi:integrase|nr:site-specific integrase [Rickettsiales bacterium]
MPKPTNTKFNFTEASIAALPFADHGMRYIAYDTSTKNLIIRVGEKSKIYYLVKKVNGRVLYVRLDDATSISVKDARAAVGETKEIIRGGKNPNDEKNKIRQDITIKEFFDEFYWPNHSKYKKKTSQKIDEVVMRLHIPPEIKRRKMLDISRGDIVRMHQKLCGEKGIYTANHSLKLIRQLYYKAIDWDWVGTNPAMRVKMFKETQRDRFLKEDEFPRFFNALADEPNIMFRNFVLLSLFVGQRRRNMQSIRWADINFERRVLYIPETKTGEPQAAHLPDQAITILREMEKSKISEWIFPSARSASGHLEGPEPLWRALLKRAGIENLRMHDLRRTFASYQAITGSSHEIIGKALGDKSPAVIPIYARLTENPVRNSIQNAADKMLTLAKPATSDKK